MTPARVGRPMASVSSSPARSRKTANRSRRNFACCRCPAETHSSSPICRKARAIRNGHPMANRSSSRARNPEDLAKQEKKKKKEEEQKKSAARTHRRRASPNEKEERTGNKRRPKRTRERRPCRYARGLSLETMKVISIRNARSICGSCRRHRARTRKCEPQQLTRGRFDEGNASLVERRRANLFHVTGTSTSPITSCRRRNFMSIPANGGEATKLTTIRHGHRRFALSPDGKQAAFIASMNEPVTPTRNPISGRSISRPTPSRRT